MRAPLLLLSTVFTLSACIAVFDTSSDHKSEHAHEHGTSGASASAMATIRGRAGSELSGTATFVERNGGVQVVITLKNTPPGWHAAHIHEHGDCSAADFTSTGGHFNPEGHDHGAPDALQHHAGDLGNIWVNEDGTGYHVLFMPELTVADGAMSVRGRAIIVHETFDDLVTQPTGAAGGRIGCGEIR
jgi:Cu-Zn family superoxide dismutase